MDNMNTLLDAIELVEGTGTQNLTPSTIPKENKIPSSVNPPHGPAIAKGSKNKREDKGKVSLQPKSDKMDKANNTSKRGNDTSEKAVKSDKMNKTKNTPKSEKVNKPETNSNLGHDTSEKVAKSGQTLPEKTMESSNGNKSGGNKKSSSDPVLPKNRRLSTGGKSSSNGSGSSRRKMSTAQDAPACKSCKSNVSQPACGKKSPKQPATLRSQMCVDDSEEPDDVQFIFKPCSTCEKGQGQKSLSTNTTEEVKVKLSKKLKNQKDLTKSHLRIWLLLLQNAKAEMLLHKSKSFKQIMKSQTLVTKQQLKILDKASDLGKLYSRNMATVLRLGFCPSELQERSQGFTWGLNRVHKMIHSWDTQMDELIIKSKDKRAVLETVFKAFSQEFGKEVGQLTDEEFAELCLEMGNIPNLLTKEKNFQELFNEIELMDVEKEWHVFRISIETQIEVLEEELQEICLEFGVRNPPAPSD